jgi:hypothetical protein
MPAPTMFLSPQIIIDMLLEGRRIYINDYPRELHDQLKDIMLRYREQYGIHHFYRDNKTGSLIENPYYWISKNPNRPPLHSLGQTRRLRKRKQTRRQH